MGYTPVQYTVTTSAVSLTTALGLSERVYPIQLDIKNQVGNTGVVYLGGSDVTNAPANAGAAISADQAWSYLPGNGTFPLSTDDIFIVGSAGSEDVFITVVF